MAANVSLEFFGRWRHPPIGEFLNVDGVQLHYIIRGDPDAPPLVMFHGNGTLLQDFIISGLVDAAASKFRVICFDRPGFGHSSRPRATLWSPERQAELFCIALSQTRHRAHRRAWPFLGHACRAGDSGAPRRSCERPRPDIWLLLPDLALRCLVRECRRHPSHRRYSALHHFSNFELACPARFREENLRAEAGAGDCQK